MDITFMMWAAVAILAAVTWMQERALVKLKVAHEALRQYHSATIDTLAEVCADIGWEVRQAKDGVVQVRRPDKAEGCGNDQ